MNFATAVGLTPMQARVGTFGLKLLWKKCQPIIITTVVIVSAAKVYSYLKRRSRRKKWSEVGKDIVILHSFPRGKYCPNLSPFVLKLETYLRLAKIEYQLDYEEPMGPKGKCPWITLNGEEYSDSQFIMEMLAEKYDKDFSGWLSDEQSAVARALLIMVDEHLFWCFIYYMYNVINCKNFFQNQEVPTFLKILFPFMKKHMKRKITYQGMGVHKFSEVQEIAEKDIRSLSVYLGTKPYMMGENICELDCAVFGLLAQIKWDSMKSPYFQLLHEKYSNLLDLCDRIKEELWPDWEQCLDI